MKKTISVEIDTDNLRSFTDEHLVNLWHVAQSDPAPCSDYDAGVVTDCIGREIIKRWLKVNAGSTYNHSESIITIWSWQSIVSGTVASGFPKLPQALSPSDGIESFTGIPDCRRGRQVSCQVGKV